ncbi:hypothetical protein FACS189450_13910 [Spirochaetia bacterium]|nr:hypothetical protein FACS189450_13910 [Spirochaetia bacterium]
MKLNCFLICDDVRSEVGNKFSLMGLYSNSINFNVTPLQAGKWPKTLKLGIFIRLDIENDSDKKDTRKFKIEYTLNNETNVLIEGDIDISSQKDVREINIAGVINQLLVKGVGETSFKLTLYNKDNVTNNEFIHSHNISIREQLVNQNNFA